MNFLDPQGWDLGSAGLGPCIDMSGCLWIWAVQVWLFGSLCVGQRGLSHVVNFFDPQGWDSGSAGLGACIHMSGCQR